MGEGEGEAADVKTATGAITEARDPDGTTGTLADRSDEHHNRSGGEESPKTHCAGDGGAVQRVASHLQLVPSSHACRKISLPLAATNRQISSHTGRPGAHAHATHWQPGPPPGACNAQASQSDPTQPHSAQDGAHHAGPDQSTSPE